MSESALIETPVSPFDGEQPLLSLLACLRSEGAQHLDPMRFHYLEVLSRRLPGAPAGARRILESKLKAALMDYEERFRQARQTASDEVARLSAVHPAQARELRRLFAAGDYRGVRRMAAPAPGAPVRTPLAQLNQYIQAATQDRVENGPGEMGRVDAEMKSVRRFRQTWSRISAENQVKQAVGRGPENAGPLNSHMLVLRSLALMRDLSPDYLQRFLSHVDTLLWLDQASQKTTPQEAKPARRSRPRK